MGMTAEQLKDAFGIAPIGVSRRLADALREFGYSQLTDEWTEQEIKRLLEGGEPKGGPSMFLATWFKDGVD